MGRPGAFEGERGAERKAKLLQAIREGNTREAAARLAGVSPTTLYKAMSDSEDFDEEVRQADAAHESAMVDLITSAVRKDPVRSWQAAAWMLERRNPAKWGKQERAPMVPIDDDIAALADELSISIEEAKRLMLEAPKPKALKAGQ